MDLSFSSNLFLENSSVVSFAVVIHYLQLPAKSVSTNQVRFILSFVYQGGLANGV